MSYSIPTAQVQTYSTNVQMLLQQQGSRLRRAVQEQACQGKSAAFVEQFGSTSPVFNQARHSDTPLIEINQDRRWLFPNDADWAQLIDDQDRLRLLIDPAGPYTTGGAWAMGRAQDDAIIGGLFGDNKTGENGTSSTGLLSAWNSGSQVVGATVGATGNTGLNVAKLRAAKQKLLAAEVDPDNDELYMAITARQHDDLLNEAQAINLDYTNKPVLVDGKITEFMGFKFILTERIPGGSRFNTTYPGNSSITGYTTGTTWLVPFWAKSGVTLGLWNDVQVSVDRRADKRNSWQVYVTGTFGASRNEELRCGIITCY